MNTTNSDSQSLTKEILDAQPPELQTMLDNLLKQTDKSIELSEKLCSISNNLKKMEFSNESSDEKAVIQANPESFVDHLWIVINKMSKANRSLEETYSHLFKTIGHF